MSDYVGSRWAPREPMPPSPKSDSKNGREHKLEVLSSSNTTSSRYALSEGDIRKEANAKRAAELRDAWFAKRWWLKSWRHYKRHWCLYTTGIIIFLAIFLPLFFVYAIPAIAQRMVDDADLPIKSAALMNPTENTIDISIVASIAVPAPFSVTLDPISLTLFRQETEPDIIPFAHVNLPEEHLKGDSIIGVTKQTTTIENQDQFVKFLSSAVYYKSFQLSVTGETDAHIGALKAHITLEKTITLLALDSLKDFSIESARFIFPARSDGTNLAGVANFPNPSILTVELGNITMTMYSGDLPIGEGRLQNVVLVPGDNPVPLSATLNIRKLINNLPEFLESQAEFLKKGNLGITAYINSAIVNDKHIRYFEETLLNLHPTAEVPIMDLLTESLPGLLNCPDSNPKCSGVNNSLESLLNLLNGTSLEGISHVLSGDRSRTELTKAKAILSSGLRDLN